MQTTNNILIVRPSNFVFNAETAGSNAFQNVVNDSDEAIKQKVFEEFEEFAKNLKSKGINVCVVDDTATPQKPDAIFPNNWVSFHADGTVILYPMFAVNRRYERRMDIIEMLKQQFKIKKIVDLSHYEAENKFLEGTGSIVFDHTHKIAYACLSPRTHKDLLIELCEKINYRPIYFYAHDKSGKEIYHTNVMMCVGKTFAVVCLDSITNPDERSAVVDSIFNSKKELIDITFEQMNHFAGNMLELRTADAKGVLALSKSSYHSLSQEQRHALEKHCKLVPLAIQTIETIGGGSARCMIAEIFCHKIDA